MPVNVLAASGCGLQCDFLALSGGRIVENKNLFIGNRHG
jgi:hypothetical protein